MPDEHPLTGKTPEDLRKLGEAICSVGDWRWCVHWVCALHRQFRSHFKPRDYWTAYDELVACELEWHRGKDLFDTIRRESLAGIGHETAEGTHYRIAEIGAKCISNASWSPGLFDFHAPYGIPSLVIHLTRQLARSDEERRWAFDLISLAHQSQPRPREATFTRMTQEQPRANQARLAKPPGSLLFSMSLLNSNPHLAFNALPRPEAASA